MATLLPRRHGATQAVAYTGTAAPSTTAFAAGTHRVRVVANSACHIVIGGTPVAVVTDPFLPANTVEELTVNPGEKISAVRAATGGLVTETSGTLWVTELA
jgi:nicotinamide mononucleotide (NMN) deamidase PncC